MFLGRLRFLLGGAGRDSFFSSSSDNNRFFFFFWVFWVYFLFFFFFFFFLCEFWIYSIHLKALDILIAFFPMEPTNPHVRRGPSNESYIQFLHFSLVLKQSCLVPTPLQVLQVCHYFHFPQCRCLLSLAFYRFP